MTAVKKDAHGQPISAAISASRRTQRSVDEMIGLCKGILADGKVAEEEVRFLSDWLVSNPDAIGEWPGNVLSARICDALKDGVLDKGELDDLYSLLSQVTGSEPLKEIAKNASTALPLDDPAPKIIFKDRLFCFTGEFAFGPRDACEQEVLALGGKCHPRIVQKLDYLVIGLFGSRDWLHSSYGTKIQKALELRNAGHKLVLVGEDHWASFLDQPSNVS